MRKKLPRPIFPISSGVKPVFDIGVDDDIVEAGRLIGPRLVGALPNPRTGRRATLSASAWSGSTRWRPAARSSARRGAVGTRTGLSEFGVSAYADVIDTDDVDQRADIARILQRRVGEVRPDADGAIGISDHFGLLVADESRAHHLCHARIVAQLCIKTGVGDDDRPGCELERGLCRFQVGMGKIDENPSNCIP